ncbi:ANTAR domain-containing protein [Streptomyces sp. NPDC086783]|uniref:ANTAR domain-containing protein n=1 Tax=Streptomyces sp. NPDC086783 TaxID=3365758 RepID=UPI0037FC874A
MQRTTMLQEDWWKLRAEATWGNPATGEDVVILRDQNDQLRRAMAGRAVVDQARGMVMVLTPCTRGAARGLLVNVSRECDTKLAVVAAAVVAAWEGEPLPDRMRRALRRTLRNFHAQSRQCNSRRPDRPPVGEKS